MAIVGSMTLKKQLARRGGEPDESYYVENEPRVRGKREVSLEADPPPDLCIEVQLTRSALDKLGIYGAMGVPEVWLWEEDRLKVYWRDDSHHGETARYVERERSRAFPGLPLEALVRFLGELKSKSSLCIVQEFRAWLTGTPARP